MRRVGIAMLQGARHEHLEALQNAADSIEVPIEVVQLRKASDVCDIDALILPGGESTAMRLASAHERLLPALFEWMLMHPKRPVLGTCAGAILLANPELGFESFMPIDVRRNGWGRQRNSFEAEVQLSQSFVDENATHSENASQTELALRDEYNHQPLLTRNDAKGAGLASNSCAYPGVFIRAPRFELQENSAPELEVIATLEEEVVGVKLGKKIALTFHPELTLDRRFHLWLLANIGE